jgi:hypothetical protein
VALSDTAEQSAVEPTWFGLSQPDAAEPAARDSAAVGAFADTVRRLAQSEFASAMKLPEQVWAAYVVTATREYQRTLANGSVSWQDLSSETIDELLRCGYLLRCLDEALTSSPI